MSRILKLLFFLLIIRPIVLIGLGLNVVNRDNLPLRGPAIIAAHHNSHFDTMVLMSLYPLSKLHLVRPVAAADYFLKNRFIAWFSTKVIDILPLARFGADKNTVFDGCVAALRKNQILILFPEGSRGQPEQLGTIKKGLFHLAQKAPDAPVIPVVMHGLGKTLPRGAMIPVPFNCDVVIGKPLPRQNTADAFVDTLRQSFEESAQYCITRREA